MTTARKTLDTGGMQLYTLKDEQSQVINNRDEMIKVVEEFYRKLFISNDRQTKDMEIMNIEVPCVNTS